MPNYINKEDFLKKINSPKVKAIVGAVGVAWVKSLLSKIPTVGWIPVKKRYPTKNGTYLCYYNAFGIDRIKTLNYSTDLYKLDKYEFPSDSGGGFYNYDSEWGYSLVDNVTHWMELPEIPEEVNNNE